MKTRPDIERLERGLLHALLVEYDGLNIEDVACELDMTRPEAEALLDAEMRSGVVDLTEDSVYISLRKTTSVSSAIARVRLAEARHGLQARKRVWLVAIPSAALALALVLYFAMRPSTATIDDPLVVSTPVGAAHVSFEDRAEARLAGERRRQWETDAMDRERRIMALETAAVAADCSMKWSAGAPCYVSHRNLSKAEFDEERALLTMELAKLRRLLAESR